MSTGTNRRARAGLSLVLAGGVAAAAGWARLPLPPGDPAGWVRWWERAGPLVSVFALARAAVLAGAGAWGLVAFVGLIAPAGRIRSLVDHRPLVGLVVGLSLSGLTAAGCSGGGPNASPPPLLLDITGPTGPQSVAGPGPPALPVPAPATVAVEPRPPPPAEWVVRPGDDLWSIAAATVGAEDVAAYWLRVISANRARLPDPADPSLLFPGDVVLLPPPG